MTVILAGSKLLSERSWTIDYEQLIKVIRDTERVKEAAKTKKYTSIRKFQSSKNKGDFLSPMVIGSFLLKAITCKTRVIR